MRAVVIGGSGQIGGWLRHWLDERGHQTIGTYATVETPGCVPFDAADKEDAASWLRACRPQAVYYPAGFTWVDGCERDPARAMDANRDQPLNLARVANDIGAKFVYFSTDYVFDGTDGPNSESDAPNPLSVYGRSKLEAEQTLQRELGELALILRTTWVFGPERQGKNFAYQLARTLREGKTLACPSDQISNPTYGSDIALVAAVLTERGESGVFHIAGPDRIARPAFAESLARGLGLDERLIVAKPTAELGQGAPRPLNGGLKSERLDPMFAELMRPLSSTIPEFRDCGPPWRSPLSSGL